MARTPKARALGAALRAAREDRDVTLRDLADSIKRNAGVLSRYETGDRSPKPEHVSQMLTALRINGDRYDEIMSLAYDTDAPLWVATTLPEQRQQLSAFVNAEQNATHIADVSPLLVPGLLQTDDYIRAIMSGGGVAPDEVVTRVKIRIGLRRIITGQQATEFTAFIGQAALHQIIGSHAVMLGQFRHLGALGRLPNVHIHIVPFDSGWHPGLEGAFTVIDPGQPTSLVLIENRKSGLFLHEKADIQVYLDAVERVRLAARDETESLRLISELANRMERVQ